MGLLSRIKALGVTDEKAWNPSLWNLFGSQSLTGEVVTESTALTFSAVWNAVSLISGTVSTLPLHLLRKDRSKTVQATEKRLFRVLHDRFNEYMTAQVGREVMVAHILLWGNCYAEIVRNGFGEIVALWPIPPNRIRPMMENQILSYLVSVDGQEIPLSRSQILHIPGLGFDGFQGYSVVSMARKSLGLGMAMETFGSAFFKNGASPSIVATHPGSLSPIARKNITDSLNEQTTGLSNAHRILLLEEGLAVSSLGFNPGDSQFLESRQFHISEIARWFNLPPHKLKDLSRSSFNNIESEQISFVTDSILPWLIRFEQHFNAQLLTENEVYRQFLYTRHNVDGLLRGNAKDRAEYYRIMFGIGMISINEGREKEGWDPVSGGDEHFIPLNMIPLSRIGEYLDRQGKTSTEGNSDEKSEAQSV